MLALKAVLRAFALLSAACLAAVPGASAPRPEARAATRVMGIETSAARDFVQRTDEILNWNPATSLRVHDKGLGLTCFVRPLRRGIGGVIRYQWHDFRVTERRLSDGSLAELTDMDSIPRGAPQRFLSAVLYKVGRDTFEIVAKIARHLGIASSERQPFPGPGLAVRVLGDVTRERADACRIACDIVERRIMEAAQSGLCDLPWQYFAALLPVRSVGVHGDARVHGETIVVRAVTSLDGMSARYSPIPHDVLSGISTEITNSLKGHVNRVVYDITHKPPGTIEWE